MGDQRRGGGGWRGGDERCSPPQQGPTPPPEAVPPTQPVQPVQPFGGQPVQPFGAPPPGPMAGPPTGPAPAAAPQKSGGNRGPLIAVIVAVVALVAAVTFFATRDSGDKKNASATSSSSSKSSSSSSKSSSSKSTSSSSSSASGAPDIEAPSGFKVFQSEEDQFAIAIPQGMDDVDLSRGDIDQILNELESNNPNFASVGPQVRSVLASGGKLFAIDSSTAASTGFADNVNLIAVAGNTDVSNPSVESQIRQQLSAIPAND